MNLKKLGLITLLASASLLSVCGGCSNSNKDNSSGTTSEEVPDGKVKVTFYVDWNATNSPEVTWRTTNDGVVYQSVIIDQNTKVAKPADPATPPQAEFPVFLGWSRKETIDNKQDLWNFDTDVVNVDGKYFSLFGIWVAAGES